MITGHDIAMALRSAYWSMHRRADAHFGQAGVTADQVVLLAALAQAAEHDAPEGTTQQELVRRTASDPSTVRAMLVLLEGRRLVARRRHPTDRRARSVSITDKGKRIYQKLWNGSEELQCIAGRLRALLDPAAVVEVLRRLSEAMSSPPPGRRAPAPAAAPARTTRTAAPAPRE